MTKYPSSVYVKDISGRLSYYKQEQKRIELAEEDSLKAANYVFIDSTGTDSTIVEQEFSSADQQIEEKTGITETIKENNQLVNHTAKIKEPLWNPRKKKY